MFHRIHTFHRVVGADGMSYLPRAYGDPDADGSWNGYLAFFPRTGTPVTTDRQITEPTLSRLKDWAGSLSLEDLRAALARARVVSRDSQIDAGIVRLRYLENEAQLDADDLEEQAELNEESATEAREAAERLWRRRVVLEDDTAKLR